MKHEGLRTSLDNNFFGRPLDKEEFTDLYLSCKGNLEDMATARRCKLDTIITQCLSYDLDIGDYTLEETDNLPHKKIKSSSIDNKYYKIWSLPS